MSSAKSPRGARAKNPTPQPAAGAPDPVSDGVLGLLELFRADLAEVRFPDVDREVLDTACDAVRAADAEVARLFAELEAAQVKLAEEKQALGRIAERGVAYARIFAADNEPLVEKLDALDLGGPKRPGRKPKAKPVKAVTRPRRPEAAAAAPSPAPEPEDEKQSA